MKVKLITIITISIIISSVFLVFYPLKFDFYEQLKTKRIVDIIVLPIFIIVLGYYIIKKVKNDGANWKTFSKEILFAIAIFGIFYFTIIRSVLSCGLLFINRTVKEKVEINGTITDILKIEGHGKVIGKYEITINQNGKEYNFESNKNAMENYRLNGKFKMEMNKGILNIVYK
jgi:hypothetical protein